MSQFFVLSVTEIWQSCHISMAVIRYCFAYSSCKALHFYFAINTLHKQEAELLFQVISMCYEAKSIIITTNLLFGQLNHVFGDPILTEAVIGHPPFTFDCI